MSKEDDNKVIDFQKEKEKKIPGVLPRTANEIFKGIIGKMGALAGNIQFVKENQESLDDKIKLIEENLRELESKYENLEGQHDKLKERYDTLLAEVNDKLGTIIL